MYTKVKQPNQKLKYVNNIKYDAKSYQIKMTIVNWIDVWLKGLKY